MFKWPFGKKKPEPAAAPKQAKARPAGQKPASPGSQERVSLTVMSWNGKSGFASDGKDHKIYLNPQFFPKGVTKLAEGQKITGILGTTKKGQQAKAVQLA